MDNDPETWEPLWVRITRCIHCAHPLAQHDNKTGKCFFGPGHYAHEMLRPTTMTGPK
jgi:hypothetical protein